MDTLKDVQFLDKNDMFWSGGKKDVMQLPLQTCTCDITNIFRGEFSKKKESPLIIYSKHFYNGKWQDNLKRFHM